MKFVLIVGLSLFLAGLYLVLLSAFRKRLAWAIGILVLPVVYPVYALMHWSNNHARNGFLTSIVGLLMTSVAVYGGAVRDVTKNSSGLSHQPIQETVKALVNKVPTAIPPDEPLPNETEAAMIVLPEGLEYDPFNGDEEFTYSDLEPLAPTSDSVVQIAKVSMPESQFQEISATQLGEHIGKRIRITLKQREIKEGKLVGAKGGSLVLAQAAPGGTVSFQYRLDDLQKLLVYAQTGTIQPMIDAEQGIVGVEQNYLNSRIEIGGKTHTAAENEAPEGSDDVRSVITVRPILTATVKDKPEAKLSDIQQIPSEIPQLIVASPKERVTAEQ